MNKEKAEAWRDVITELLSGKTLICTSAAHGQIEVHQNEQFEKSYIVHYKDGSYCVALSTSGWVMTGSREWELVPEQRTIRASSENGHGDECLFAWTISDSDHDGKVFYAMKAAQERLWRVQ